MYNDCNSIYRLIVFGYLIHLTSNIVELVILVLPSETIYENYSLPIKFPHSVHGDLRYRSLLNQFNKVVHAYNDVYLQVYDILM